MKNMKVTRAGSEWEKASGSVLAPRTRVGAGLVHCLFIHCVIFTRLH